MLKASFSQIKIFDVPINMKDKIALKKNWGSNH